MQTWSSVSKVLENPVQEQWSLSTVTELSIALSSRTIMNTLPTLDHVIVPDLSTDPDDIHDASELVLFSFAPAGVARTRARVSSSSHPAPSLSLAGVP